MLKDFFEDENKRKIAKAAALVVLAILSFFIVSGLATDAENFKGTISEMDKKSKDVMALTAASTAASAAITLIPDDVGTPIAEKLADLSGYFLFVLAAIYFEKWMVTVSGFIAFKLFIPACLLLLAYLLFRPNSVAKLIAMKVIAFSVIIFLIVPVSVQLSNLIDDSYEESMKVTVEEAEQRSKEIHDNVDTDTGNVIKDFWNTVKGGISGQIEKYKNLLSNFVQAIAVLMVTSVAIPIAVLMFAVWLLKLIAGVDVNGSRLLDIKLSEKLKELKA